MIEEFKNKLGREEYISNYLFEYVKNNDSSVIPTGFDIDKYDKKILDKLYKENKEYFDNMYKGVEDNIHLDEEQCKAILADEKYSLIIAGAGTGKTTTMVSKVKYLVDKKKADPNKILVMILALIDFSFFESPFKIKALNTISSSRPTNKNLLKKSSIVNEFILNPWCVFNIARNAVIITIITN